MALPGEMIQLCRANIAENSTQGRAIGEIAIVEKQASTVNFFIAPQMLDARSQQIARAPHDSMHSVIFLQEQFRQIGTVLASDSGNQGNFLGLFHLRSNRVLPSFVIIKRGNNQALSAVRESNVRLPWWCKGLSSDEQRMLAAQPLGCAKVFSYWATVNYRESYTLCASNAIMFNHESPRRGETFVTRKISRAVAAIKHGLQKELFLGNLDGKRDWAYAPEYVEGARRILQTGEGDDFILATGESHTVREFVEAAFGYANLDWKEFVKHDPRYERPAEVDVLLGDASKAKNILDWEPRVRFHELVRIMVAR